VKSYAPDYYHLGRWIMLRRAAFSKRALASLAAWMGSVDAKEQIKNDRVILTTGVAYSTFTTLAEMLGCPLSPDQRAAFRTFAITQGSKTLGDVRDETFRNRFWRDIITGLNLDRSGIRPKYFGLQFVTLKLPGEDGILRAVAEDYFTPTSMIRKVLTQKQPAQLLVTDQKQHKYAEPVVFIAAQELYDEWLRDLAGTRQVCPISFSNLRAEIEREAYWIPPPRRSDGYRADSHRQRFDIEEGGKTKPYSCWCVSLGREVGPAGEQGDYIFPFAQPLIDALETKVPPGEQ